jgi:hypothetical protein
LTDSGDPNVIALEYEGLQMQREFYSPIYETDVQIKSRIPDFRNLLYWSPDLKTRADGNTEISFYSSDREGRYIAVIQGMTTDGKTGSQSLQFEVGK